VNELMFSTKIVAPVTDNEIVVRVEEAAGAGSRNE
jgi:hypothetical protein